MSKQYKQTTLAFLPPKNNNNNTTTLGVQKNLTVESTSDIIDRIKKDLPLPQLFPKVLQRFLQLLQKKSIGDFKKQLHSLLKTFRIKVKTKEYDITSWKEFLLNLCNSSSTIESTFPPRTRKSFTTWLEEANDIMNKRAPLPQSCKSVTSNTKIENSSFPSKSNFLQSETQPHSPLLTPTSTSSKVNNDDNDDDTQNKFENGENNDNNDDGGGDDDYDPSNHILISPKHNITTHSHDHDSNVQKSISLSLPISSVLPPPLSPSITYSSDESEDDDNNENGDEVHHADNINSGDSAILSNESDDHFNFSSNNHHHPIDHSSLPLKPLRPPPPPPSFQSPPPSPNQLWSPPPSPFSQPSPPPIVRSQMTQNTIVEKLEKVEISKRLQRAYPFKFFLDDIIPPLLINKPLISTTYFRNSPTHTFLISQSLHDALEMKRDLSVRLICSYVVNMSTQMVLPPHGISIMVNKKQINANTKKYATKKLTMKCIFGINITSLCHVGENTLQAIIPSQIKLHYSLSVKCAQRVSIDQLVSYVKSLPAATRNVENDDDDVEEEYQTVSLICPISHLRIDIPTRSTLCSHSQCFDLEAYLRMNKLNPQWKCAICSKEIFYSELYVDPPFLHILSQLNSAVDECEDENDDDDDDDSYIRIRNGVYELFQFGKRRYNGGGAEQIHATQNKRIKLEDDDDDDRTDDSLWNNNNNHNFIEID